eukprot:1815505-Rhodomonas_salina.3
MGHHLQLESKKTGPQICSPGTDGDPAYHVVVGSTYNAHHTVWYPGTQVLSTGGVSATGSPSRWATAVLGHSAGTNR